MLGLDRPVWASLSGPHQMVAVGDARARRYAPDVNLFAATRDPSMEARAALAELVTPGQRVYLCEAAEIGAIPGFASVSLHVAVQMIAERPIDTVTEPFAVLGEADAPEMLALARLTEPGPFLARTHTMGRFIGLRIDGRLAAMAGERFRFAGYTEVSGVCTHPDYRGRGLARRLSAAVSARIQARGEQPFLHAWRSNQAAIRLYDALGFRHRADMQVAVLER